MPYLTAVQGQIKLGKFLGCVIFGRVWQVWYMVCGQVKVRGEVWQVWYMVCGQVKVRGRSGRLRMSAENTVYTNVSVEKIE